MDDSSWQMALGAGAMGIPTTFALAAASVRGRGPFTVAGVATTLGLLLALSSGLAWLMVGETGVWVPVQSLTWTALRLDAVTFVMLALVGFVAFVIARFSRTYLAGEPGQVRYVRWLMATLAAVTTLIVTDNLMVLALAWVGTSVALHQLLTFYETRTQALVAAHKKFLVSRVADLSLFVAIALLALNAQSLALDDVHRLASAAELPVSVQVAAVLLVLSAGLKCAQLPFHGWLTQVMEAPTPVSALLHAGVVNIGGFLMIRLAPVMVKADVAQGLLVLMGTTTAVVAALVMTTRVSVKVMLAWSTIAQMGFMLLQCGLGAYGLALLHIVAHSLYKAHAFLASGSAVELYRSAKITPARPAPAMPTWIGAAFVGLLTVVGVGALFGVSPAREPALWALALVLGLALTPLIVRLPNAGRRTSLMVLVATVAVPALYFGWHAMFGLLFQAPGQASGTPWLRIVIVGAGFTLLYGLQAAMKAHPRGALASWLYPRLFAGLYLDEVFTRLTFRIWPPRLPTQSQAGPTLSLVKSLKV